MIHNVNKTKGPNFLQITKIDYVCMLDVYASKHTQSVKFVVYACKNTQQANIFFVVYARKHAQQILLTMYAF